MTRTAAFPVMIQDVNLLNSLIFLGGYMYVGGRRMIKMPVLFAPHFTKDCGGPGIRFYSRVFTVVEVQAEDLRTYPKKELMLGDLDAEIRRHRSWECWQHGLAAIAERARSEPGSSPFPGAFRSRNDPHRLYFLGGPVELGRTIKKEGLPMIVPGFGCSYADLFEMRDLRDRGRPCPPPPAPPPKPSAAVPSRSS